jgi:hypothetical protein
LTFGSIFFGTMDILPTQKDAAQNLGRFNVTDRVEYQDRNAVSGDGSGPDHRHGDAGL